MALIISLLLRVAVEGRRTTTSDMRHTDMAVPAHLRARSGHRRFVLLPLALHLCLELPPPRNLLGGQGERRPRPLEVRVC